jgi:DSF synthase
MTYVNQYLSTVFQTDFASRSDAVPFAAPTYRNLDCRHEVQDRSFWCYLNPTERPSFTPGLIADLHDVQGHISGLSGRGTADRDHAIGWVVLASSIPGIFSLGGDLTIFSQKIRARDTEGLRDYAYSCVDIAYQNASGYGGNAISIGLAQGEALGGGFESLLSCDVIFAERRARFGLPEVLMNLFPGMGAHAFLTQRIGSAAAMKLILSGQVYSAEAMHDMGIVDVLVEDGKGEDEVRHYIARNASRHHAHAAIYKARRVAAPITRKMLRDITDVWVETAMALTEKDLRRMTHLVSAQDRSLQRQIPQPAAACA